MQNILTQNCNGLYRNLNHYYANGSHARHKLCHESVRVSISQFLDASETQNFCRRKIFKNILSPKGLPAVFATQLSNNVDFPRFLLYPTKSKPLVCFLLCCQVQRYSIFMCRLSLLIFFIYLIKQNNLRLKILQEALKNSEITRILRSACQMVRFPLKVNMKDYVDLSVEKILSDNIRVVIPGYCSVSPQFHRSRPLIAFILTLI